MASGAFGGSSLSCGTSRRGVSWLRSSSTGRATAVTTAVPAQSRSSIISSSSDVSQSSKCSSDSCEAHETFDGILTDFGLGSGEGYSIAGVEATAAPSENISAARVPASDLASVATSVPVSESVLGPFSASLSAAATAPTALERKKRRRSPFDINETEIEVRVEDDAN